MFDDDEEPTRPDLPDSVRAVNARNVAAIKPKLPASNYSFNLAHAEGDDVKPPIPLTVKKSVIRR